MLDRKVDFAGRSAARAPKSVVGRLDEDPAKRFLSGGDVSAEVGPMGPRRRFPRSRTVTRPTIRCTGRHGLPPGSLASTQDRGAEPHDRVDQPDDASGCLHPRLPVVHSDTPLTMAGRSAR